MTSPVAGSRSVWSASGASSLALTPLRRLRLPGRRLELGGPTIDGGFAAIDEHVAPRSKKSVEKADYTENVATPRDIRQTSASTAASPQTGQVVLVAFWSSDSEEFRNDIPLIQAAVKKFDKRRFAILGVNLDQEEFNADALLSETSLPGRHIFYSELSRRGFNNPIVRYYGVSHVPTYWLVDPQGLVAAAPLEIDQLEDAVKKLSRP